MIAVSTTARSRAPYSPLFSSRPPVLPQTCASSSPRQPRSRSLVTMIHYVLYTAVRYFLTSNEFFFILTCVSSLLFFILVIVFFYTDFIFSVVDDWTEILRARRTTNNHFFFRSKENVCFPFRAFILELMCYLEGRGSSVIDKNT